MIAPTPYCVVDDIIDRTVYPSGEWHLQLNLERLAGVRTIELTARHFNDICSAIVVDRALRRIGQRVTWFVPFMPFARDDRRNSPADAMELELALELLEDLDAVIVDPHSDVSARLRHVQQKTVVRIVCERMGWRGPQTFVVPDAGARKKAHTWLHSRDTVIYGDKRRSSVTGKLDGFRLSIRSGLDPLANHIIVDDLADGGGTFLGLANLLRGAGAKRISLVVTHGLFTKGYDAFEDFEHVVTFDHTNSLRIDSPDLPGNVTLLPYRQLFNEGKFV